MKLTGAQWEVLTWVVQHQGLPRRCDYRTLAALKRAGYLSFSKAGYRVTPAGIVANTLKLQRSKEK